MQAYSSLVVITDGAHSEISEKADTPCNNSIFFQNILTSFATVLYLHLKRHNNSLLVLVSRQPLPMIHSGMILCDRSPSMLVQ